MSGFEPVIFPTTRFLSRADERGEANRESDRFWVETSGLSGQPFRGFTFPLHSKKPPRERHRIRMKGHDGSHDPTRSPATATVSRIARCAQTAPCRAQPFSFFGDFFGFLGGSDFVYASARVSQWASWSPDSRTDGGTTTYSRMGRPGMGSKIPLPFCFRNAVRSSAESRMIMLS